MYLVSIYFDEKTNEQIKRLIQKTAGECGNTFMLDGNVPPHITISAFETKKEKEVIERLKACALQLSQGKLQWVSVGTFLPHVLYITPVLNEYLHNMAVDVLESVNGMEDTIIRKCYQPFQWLPHTTIGKTLTKEQLQTAFAVLQEQFVVFEGTAMQIGLAKTNPYTELALFELKEMRE